MNKRNKANSYEGIKIYHTETQEDYDSLMIELEAKGYTWGGTTSKPSQFNAWKFYKNPIGIMLDNDIIRHSSLDHYQSEYPFIPIIKYKAKADEKMRFTKENVGKLFSDHDKYICYSLSDLQDEILRLDDTPEKVVVPKFVAEWYESQTSSSYNIYKMIENLRNGSELEELVLIWLNGNYSKYGLRDRFDLLALIRINGYTIELEPLYYIPLPHLETSDGLQQMLSKQKNGMNYFACRQDEKLKQRFTKAELEQVPEVYKFYATLIEEEE